LAYAAPAGPDAAEPEEQISCLCLHLSLSSLPIELALLSCNSELRQWPWSKPRVKTWVRVKFFKAALWLVIFYFRWEYARNSAPLPREWRYSAMLHHWRCRWRMLLVQNSTYGQY
jgi:hypothetical protein